MSNNARANTENAPAAALNSIESNPMINLSSANASAANSTSPEFFAQSAPKSESDENAPRDSFQQTLVSAIEAAVSKARANQKGKIAEVKGELAKLKGKIVEVKGELAALNDKVERLAMQIAEVEKKIADLRSCFRISDKDNE